MHIDGFVGLVAHTIIVGEKETKGKKADVVLAAYQAIQASLRLLRPGNLNYQVKTNNWKITDTIKLVTETYKTNPLEGVLSHNVSKFFLDGNACIINKETFDQKVEEYEF